MAMTGTSRSEATVLDQGCVVVSVGGQKTASTADLGNVLAGLKPGQKVSIQLLRQDGKRVTVSATLGEYPG